MNKKLLVIALIIMIVMSVNVLGGVFALEPGVSDQGTVDPQNTLATPENDEQQVDSEDLVASAAPAPESPPAFVPDWVTEPITVEAEATTVDPMTLVVNVADVEAAGGVISGGDIVTAEDGSMSTQAFVTLDGNVIEGPIVVVEVAPAENAPEELGADAVAAQALPIETLPPTGGNLTEVTGNAKAEMNVTFYAFNIRPVQNAIVKDSKDVVLNQEMNIFINMLNPAPIFVERYNYYGYSYGAETTIPRTGDPTSLFSLLGLTLSGAGIAILRKQR